MTAAGFHEGEIATQHRAGVEAAASRLEGMLEPPSLSGGAAAFLAQQRFAAMTARDSTGQLWVSPLSGPPGFLQASEEHLRIATAPRAGDPLHSLHPMQPVGMIAVNFSARRRLRVNGTLVKAGADELLVHADQAYGNCPQYIHRHTVDEHRLRATPRQTPTLGSSMSRGAQTLITTSDTFFLGTIHPTRGADASHRGGPPGFVRIETPTTLWWPDYPGNNMFNSFGNLAVDNTAALLFIDFASGTTLHLSGSAQVIWTDPGVSGDDGGTGRRVTFTIEAAVEVNA